MRRHTVRPQLEISILLETYSSDPASYNKNLPQSSAQRRGCAKLHEGAKPTAAPEGRQLGKMGQAKPGRQTGRAKVHYTSSTMMRHLRGGSLSRSTWQMVWTMRVSNIQIHSLRRSLRSHQRSQCHKQRNGCAVIHVDDGNCRARIFIYGSYIPAKVYICFGSFFS